MSSNGKRWKPSDANRAALLKSAGYQCAICRRPFKTVEKQGKNGMPETRYLAEAAHMYPHSDDGERGTPSPSGGSAIRATASRGRTRGG